MAKDRGKDSSFSMGGGSDAEDLQRVLEQIRKETEKIHSIFTDMPKEMKKTIGLLKQIQVSKTSVDLTHLEKALNLSYDKLNQATAERIKLTLEANLKLAEHTRMSDRLYAEDVKKHAQMITDRELMIEDQKTKRQRMKMVSKVIGGSMSKGDILGGILGLGVGGLQTGVSTGGEKAGGLLKSLSSRVSRFATEEGENAKSFKSPMGKPESFGATLSRISPLLSKVLVSGKGGGAVGVAGAVGEKAGGGLASILGGGGAAGIIGGIISKGLDSSPMFQAISKIMNQAFSLILRPIGDFFSAVFKPISIVLMKWGAVNLRRWAADMSNGVNEAMNKAELLGKSIVAFFNNPLKFFERVAEYFSNLIWIGSKEAVDKFTASINEDVNNISDKLDKELGALGDGIMAKGAGVISGLETKVAETRTKADEANTTLKEIAANTAPKKVVNVEETQKKAVDYLNSKEGMKEVTEDYKKWVAENISEQDEWWKKVGQFIKGLIPKEKAEELKKKKEEMDKKIMEQAKLTKEAFDKLSPTAQAILDKYVKFKEANDKLVEVQSDITNGIYKTTEANKLAIDAQLKFSEMNRDKEIKLSEMMASSEAIKKANYEAAKMDSDWAAENVADIGDTFWHGADDFYKAYRKAMDALERLQTASKTKSGAKPKSGKAGGGIITERIFGVGERSGIEYLFGESGKEFIVPANKTSNNIGSNNFGSVNINIHIDKVTSDVDLQKIKPIVERALLETHARRGII